MSLKEEERDTLVNKMETMRERADYDVTFTATEAIINERFGQVEQMIHHIKELVGRKRS